MKTDERGIPDFMRQQERIIYWHGKADELQDRLQETANTLNYILSITGAPSDGEWAAIRNKCRNALGEIKGTEMKELDETLELDLRAWCGKLETRLGLLEAITQDRLRRDL